ncbi:MAG: AraC family transcriptional regulator [bacterium]|nr:AraC family transcriptional regulator [bacterium]
MSDYIVKKIIKIIFDSKVEDFRYLTVDWLAREVGVSLPYLSCAFRKQVGITLKVFLDGHKAYLAVQLLTQRKRLTVKEVAERMDFCSSHGFVKLFRRFLGTTPENYRDSLKAQSKKMGR